MIWIPDTSVFPSEECKFCVTVANPQSEDSPLIAVSEEFETMTGFSRHEILGVNCRFLNPGVDMNPQDEAGNQNSWEISWDKGGSRETWVEENE